jgi:hypothetical protein
MSEANPYEVTRVPVADAQPPVVKRPVFVTVALALLWILLVLMALGSIAQIRTLASVSDMGSMVYIAYLAGMVLVPAFLLVMIAQSHNWARIALVLFYFVSWMFRVFLFVNDGNVAAAFSGWFLMPVIATLIAFALLFLPGSGRWFRHAA